MDEKNGFKDQCQRDTGHAVSAQIRGFHDALAVLRVFAPEETIQTIPQTVQMEGAA